MDRNVYEVACNQTCNDFIKDLGLNEREVDSWSIKASILITVTTNDGETYIYQCQKG